MCLDNHFQLSFQTDWHSKTLNSKNAELEGATILVVTTVSPFIQPSQHARSVSKLSGPVGTAVMGYLHQVARIMAFPHQASLEAFPIQKENEALPVITPAYNDKHYQKKLVWLGAA